MVSLIKITLLLLSIIILQTLNEKTEATCDCQNVSSDESVNKILSNLDTLPDLFSNEKLPNSGQETNICFELLGCLQTIPTLSKPEEPEKLQTSFKIFRQKTVVDIEFRPIKICLKGDSSRCQTYPYNLELLSNSGFNVRRRTIIVTPGYRSESFTKWQEGIKDRWLELEDVNVILVGWQGGNRGLYNTAAANTRLVARQISVLLYYMATLNSLSLTDESFAETLQLVGHSLGAHISGFVGDDFAGSVGRISGLDPAGPEFRKVNKRFRLDKSDGQLVDVLHSNACPLSVAEPCYGLEEAIGHVDYFANDGKHQPQCKTFDAFGCSHKASIDYYINFLDHEKYMRQYLDQRNHDFYRLFAISGANYEDIHRGLSLSRLCPSTSLDDNDLYLEDIDKCVIPIDFISWFDKLKKELSEKYDVDFSPNATTTTYHYFYTSEAFPFINNHNLIKIRVTKEQETTRGASELTKPADEHKVCDLILHIKMAGGAWMKNKIKKYELLDEGDHYQVIVPYISTDTASKYELARLDANDFYLNDTERLRLISGIKTAFPKSIELIGLKIDGDRKNEGGFLNKIKNFFSLGRGDSQDDGKDGLDQFHDCKLNVHSITVQPLKKIHRYFVASYSLDTESYDDPKVIVLTANQTSPKTDLLHNRNASLKTRDSTNCGSEIFIDTVILGPRDERFDIAEPEVEEDADQTTNCDKGDTRQEPGSTLWLGFTFFTVGAIVIVVMIVYIMSSNIRRSVPQDKTQLIVDDQSCL